MVPEEVLLILFLVQEPSFGGETYYAIKVDDHNFKIASTYTLATNAGPSPLTIGTGNVGGNSADTFDPGKNLYISAGKAISQASQFSFPVGFF